MSVMKTISHIAYGVYCGLAPKKGPRSIRISVDFSVFNPYVFDLTIAQETDQIEWVQAIYCDNSANPSPVSLSFGSTNQTLTWPGYSQGYLECLCPNSPHVIAKTSGTPIVHFHFLNFPVANIVWGANPNGSSGSVSIAGWQGIDGSGTITLGGTAQTLFAGIVPVDGFGVYNPDAANDLWVSDSATAVANGAGSIRLQSNGGWFETPPNYKPIGVISLVGAVTGQNFTARRW
jgi:hypothetical protein